MNVYQNNIRRYKIAIAKFEETLKTLSVLRLIVFAASAVFITVLANQRQAELLLVVVPLCLAGFAMLVKRFNALDYLLKHATYLKEINEQEVLRQENKLSGFPTGEAFISRDHSYAADLDIFGQHSLFQLINRTTTEAGEELLADWMSQPADKETIHIRQEGVRELAGVLNWRQHFQASGLHFGYAKNDYRQLLAWAEKPVQSVTRQTGFLIVCVLLSIVSTAAVVYFFSHVLTVTSVDELLPFFAPMAVSVFINSLVLKKVRTVAGATTENVHRNIKVLGAYHSLISKIESRQFKSAVLHRLQSVFRRSDYSAAREVKKLQRILEVFQVKGGTRQSGNFFYSMFNKLWFLDVCLILLTEKWKVRNGAGLRRWASAVSEFEVLSSVAGFHYANPSFAFPEIHNEPYAIQLENVGHPLVMAVRRVSNHFQLKGRGRIAMITGSNMAGKSTFLRTVGINLVLALMGAPCCASSARVSNMRIFTSMRTQDNLEEGVSSFYAELKRIEQLLTLIQSGEPIFFLLDEIFKGTNSQDRHRGSVSLIRQLEELNAFGMVSTHDLELARRSENNTMVANYNFNSEIHNGDIVFNYILTDGICRDFNASELMRKSGIKILDEVA